MSYVVCPEMVTSPDASAMTNGLLPDNMPCEAHCEVWQEAEVMELRLSAWPSFLCHSEADRS